MESKRPQCDTLMEDEGRLMRGTCPLALLAWACLALGCTTAVDPLAGPDAFRRDASVDASVQQGDSGAGADAGWRDASLAGADAATASSDAAFEPCPALPIPATCNGRTVVYREWGPEAKGDGAYFADQAPWRLGFNRLHGEIWIVKIALEDNSYLGTVSAYGDNVGGTAWITVVYCPAFSSSVIRFTMSSARFS